MPAGAESTPFEVILELARTDEPADAHAFRFEPQSYHRRLGDGTAESARFRWDETVLADLAALQRTPPDPDAQRRFGDRLYAFVKELGWSGEEERIRDALAQGRAVHLTVRSAAAEVHALPWELVTLGRHGPHLGGRRGVLVRYEWPGFSTAAPVPDPPREGGRIVFAWSASGGGLPANAHLRAIRNACAAGHVSFDASRDVVGDVSRRRLGDAFAQGPPVGVLHVLCHGGALPSRARAYGLVWDGDDDGAEVVGGDDSARLLEPYRGSLRLVVLCACFGGGSAELGSHLGSVAQALHREGFPAVVASRYPLSTGGSTVLAEALYTRLLVGPGSLEEAFLAAREALDLGGAKGDWSSLQLYARAADGPDHRPLVFKPYRGLEAFRPSDRRFFFGRRSEAEALVKRLREGARVLTVLGASGSGKSSLVLAGVVPAVVDSGLGGRPVRARILRPGPRPSAALTAAMAPAPGDGDTELLLVVDQLEELFTQAAERADAEAFVATLLGATAEPGGRARAVLTLRADFLGRCLDFDAELGARVKESAEIVLAIGEAELREAIERPAALVGLRFGNGVVEALMEALREGAASGAQARAGNLPLLEFALEALWERRKGNEIPWAAWGAIGGVKGAIAKRAEEVLGGCAGGEGRRLAQDLFSRLVQLGQGTEDTRKIATRGELESIGAGAGEELERWIQARLVTADGERVEVAHEAVIREWGTLRGWIDWDREALLVRQELGVGAERWEEAGRSPDELWRGGRLKRAAELREAGKLRLLEGEAAFLEAGEAAVRAQEQAAEARAHEERARREEAEARTRVEQGLRASLLADRPGREMEALLLGIDAVTGRGADPSKAPPVAVEGMVHGFMRVRQRASLEGHTAPIQATAFSADGTRVVTASEDKTGRLWDAKDGRLLATLEGHTNDVTAVAFSPDGTRVVTGSKDKTARLWDTTNGKLLATLQEHTSSVTAVSFSPDGKRVATASKDNTARLWDAGRGEPLAILQGHTSWVVALSFSPDGKRLATASLSGSARLWKAKNGKLLGTLQAQTTVSFSPDGTRLVTASDNMAQLWDAGDHKLLATFQGHTSSVTAVSFSPDGTRAATASKDGTARLWDTKDGKPLATLQGHTSSVTAVSFSSDGIRVATASLDQTARLWSATDGKPIATLQGHTDSVLALAFSPDGTHVVTASNDSTARLWDAREGKPLAVLDGHTDPIEAEAFSPDGTRVATASTDKTARLWDARDGKPLAALRGHRSPVLALSFSPDGTRVATASADKTARLWDAGRGKPLAILRGHTSGVTAVSFSPDGMRLVTASTDATARLWEAMDGKLLALLHGHMGDITAVSFSPDGTRVATASLDQTARLWEAMNGRPLATLLGHTSSVFALSFSPDGTRLATASRDTTARLWEAMSGRRLTVLQGHTSSVFALSFSPDGMRLATASRDTTARLWDARDGTPLATLHGHTSGVTAVSFSPDGARVATASTDGTARLWDTKTGELLAILPGHRDIVTRVAFSPDGRHLATASADGTARIWAATPEGFLIQACQYLRPLPVFADVAETCAPYLDRTP